MRVPYFGVLIIRILLFKVLNKGPLFSEPPTCRRRKQRHGPGGPRLPSSFSGQILHLS